MCPDSTTDDDGRTDEGRPDADVATNQTPQHENEDGPNVADRPDVNDRPTATGEPDETDDAVMGLLSERVPLSLLMDLSSPTGPDSEAILDEEGEPEEAWWEQPGSSAQG